MLIVITQLGNQRVYLENTDNDKSTPTNEKKGWLGVRWSW